TARTPTSSAARARDATRPPAPGWGRRPRAAVVRRAERVARRGGSALGGVPDGVEVVRVLLEPLLDRGLEVLAVVDVEHEVGDGGELLTGHLPRVEPGRQLRVLLGEARTRGDLDGLRLAQRALGVLEVADG